MNKENEMKKLMFVAAVAAGMVAFGDAIESQNIVGYQDIPIPEGYSMYTVTFKNPRQIMFDINDIVICNASGVVMDDSDSSHRSRNKILVQKLDATNGSLYDDTYKFHSKNGWCDFDNVVLTNNQVTLENAQGLYINNTQGAPMKFRVSGEVVLTPISSQLPEGYSIVGNMTPVTVDLTDITILNPEGIAYDDSSSAMRSRNKILVQKLNALTGSLYDDTYKFHSKNGWLDFDNVALGKNQVTLAPGEALYVNNTQGNVVYFKFPSPVTD